MPAPQDYHLLATLGLLFLASQIGGRIANALRAPRIVGYIGAGIVFGPHALGWFTEEAAGDRLRLIIDMALSLVAFTIGGSLEIPRLKRLGRSILVITVLQVLGAALVTFVVTAFTLPWFLGLNPSSARSSEVVIPLAMVLAAVAAATAPAATLSVVREVRARGDFTTTLLAVIALDDAVTIVLYASSVSVAGSLLHGIPLSLAVGLWLPVQQIGLSILLGAGVAVLGWLFLRFFEARDILLGVVVGLVFWTAGLALTWDLSPLLAAMCLGFVTVNFVDRGQARQAFEVVDGIEEPLFGIFFTLAGAYFDFGLASQAGGLAVLLVLSRYSGKLIGTRLGAVLSGAAPAVRRYLGLALLPAAGVTVGLVLDARDVFGETYTSAAQLMLAAIVGKTLINELTAPFLTRYALRKAQEIGQGSPQPLGKS